MKFAPKFFVVSTLVLSAICSSNTLFAKDARSLAQAAKDNGLQKLESGQVLILGNQSKEKTAKDKNSAIYIGAQKIQASGNLSGVVGSSKANIFGPVGKPGTQIISDINLPSSPSRIVQPSVVERIKKDGHANVILRTKIANRYFESNQNSSARNSKQQEFQSVKQSIQAALTKGGKLTRDLQVINGFAATIDLESLQALQRHPKIAEIRIDTQVHASLDTSTQQISATEAWSMANNSGDLLLGTGVTIAVIDTGVDYLHPDLGGCFGSTCKVIGGYDFVHFDSDPMDDNGHGTHCASTAAGIGSYPGVAPGAKILAYKVLDEYGYGYASTIIQAIQAAMDPNGDGDTSDHVDVISMSIGGYGYSEDDESLAVDNATSVGVVSAIAAGNSGPYGSVESPGTAATAITVAAACKPDQVGSNSYCADQIASFSSRGPVFNLAGTDLHKPDVAAPGVLICAARWGNSFPDSPTCIDTHHMRISGTSMATPHVAGSVAILKQSQPWLTATELKQMIIGTADTYGIDVNRQGAGIVNVQNAVLSSGAYVPTLNIQPSYWAVISSPSQQISTTSLNIAVSGVSLSPNTSILTPSLSSAIAGVSLSANPISVTNGSSTSLSATITIDNNVALAGIYSRDLLLKDESGIIKGSVHVNVNVSPTLSASVASIDYGFNDPSLASWTSSSQEIQITNLRSDISQTVYPTVTEFPVGSVTLNAPSSLTLAPGQTVSLNSSITVNNTLIANGIYSGVLSIGNGTNVTSKFTKYYTLEVVSSGVATPSSLFLHDRIDTAYFIGAAIGQQTFYIYVDHPGNYDLIVPYYYNGKSDQVIKENFPVNGGLTVVNVSKSDAIYAVNTILTLSNGKNTVLQEITDQFNFKGNKYLGFFVYTNDTSSTPGLQNYSAVSSNYAIDQSFVPVISKNSATIFYSGFSNGLSSNLTFTNTPNDFKNVTVKLGFNSTPPYTDVNMVNFSASPILFYNYFDPLNVSNINIKSLFPDSWTLETNSKNGMNVVRSNSQRANCPSSGPCNSIFETPLFHITNTTDEGFIYDPIYQPGTLANRDAGNITVGMSPMVWYGQFLNSQTDIVLNDFNYFGVIFKKQDYSIGEYSDVAFNVYNASNTLIGSGTIPGYSHGYADSDTTTGYPNYYGPTYFSVPTPGRYTLSTSIPYAVQGTTYIATVKAAFNNKLADPNPPTIRKMYVYDNAGNRTEVLKSTAKSVVEFELDPNIGTIDISKTILKYSYDNGKKGASALSSWVSAHGTTFNGSIPKSTGATKVTITILTADDTSNSLMYQFDLPVQ